jgi:hypothetical protein
MDRSEAVINAGFDIGRAKALGQRLLRPPQGAIHSISWWPLSIGDDLVCQPLSMIV